MGGPKRNKLIVRTLVRVILAEMLDCLQNRFSFWFRKYVLSCVDKTFVLLYRTDSFIH